jgi:hypothetical protein
MSPFKLLLFSILLPLGSVHAANPYGEAPLRGNLSHLPYFATDGGREPHRFSKHAINQYRLYDFYARQAEYHLSNPADSSKILPPFPGLDGGRRGHWGVTNEKSTTAFVRSQGPKFTSVTMRNGTGEMAILTGSQDRPALISYNTLQPALSSAFASAALEMPEHAFDKGVNRFGMAMTIQGRKWMETDRVEWTTGGKPIGRFAGYYLHGESVVLKLELGKGNLLDMPSIIHSPDGKNSCLLRNFEFSENMPATLDFMLPQAAEMVDRKLGTSQVEEGSNRILVRTELRDKTLLHLISSEGGIRLQVKPDGSVISLLGILAKDRLVIASWAGNSGDAPLAEAFLTHEITRSKALLPSALIAGGPSRFSQTMIVSGTLNADPAASGTAYEIDDIPVPSTNPYHAPMTLSGIAFDGAGAAFACTLVGDVWKITGLNGDLKQVVWKRFASGLDLPLGIEVVDGVPFVNTRRNIFRLVDINGDAEADFIERFNQMDLPTAAPCGNDLRRDQSGNFYFNSLSGIYQLSADGRTLARIGEDSRNPLGLGVRSDGLVLSDSSEGESNGTCSIYESSFPGNENSTAKLQRILYLPRGVDNSPGSRIFPNDQRLGPLGHGLIGVSFATGNWYHMLYDEVNGTRQAALVPMPGEFSSGACRLAVNPLDGQLFVAGLDGWGDYGITEGCLHRIRFTGRKQPQITGWKACRNGIELRFDQPLSTKNLHAGAFLVQQWNHIDSPQTYGSPEYSVLHPEQLGHDRLEIRSLKILPDQHSLFLEIPALLPAMCTQIYGRVAGMDETPIKVDIYATINRLHPDSSHAPSAESDKVDTLRVPEKVGNGNTTQKLIEHFDQLAGRISEQRPVGPEASRPSPSVSYAWIKENLIDKQCLPCHMAGTQHDLTSYQGLRAKINLTEPEKSSLLGMMGTKSMPPYPLPTVAPGVQEAVLMWIKNGAPE